MATWQTVPEGEYMMSSPNRQMTFAASPTIGASFADTMPAAVPTTSAYGQRPGIAYRQTEPIFGAAWPTPNSDDSVSGPVSRRVSSTDETTAATSPVIGMTDPFGMSQGGLSAVIDDQWSRSTMDAGPGSAELMAAVAQSGTMSSSYPYSAPASAIPDHAMLYPNASDYWPSMDGSDVGQAIPRYQSTAFDADSSSSSNSRRRQQQYDVELALASASAAAAAAAAAGVRLGIPRHVQGLHLDGSHVGPGSNGVVRQSTSADASPRQSSTSLPRQAGIGSSSVAHHLRTDPSGSGSPTIQFRMVNPQQSSAAGHRRPQLQRHRTTNSRQLVSAARSQRPRPARLASDDDVRYWRSDNSGL